MSRLASPSLFLSPAGSFPKMSPWPSGADLSRRCSSSVASEKRLSSSLCGREDRHFPHGPGRVRLHGLPPSPSPSRPHCGPTEAALDTSPRAARAEGGHARLSRGAGWPAGRGPHAPRTPAHAATRAGPSVSSSSRRRPPARPPAQRRPARPRGLAGCRQAMRGRAPGGQSPRPRPPHSPASCPTLPGS